VYSVSELPYGFDGDEAAFGYYAYSLINNLSDEFGNKLPLYFPSIGDYKYPIYSYLSIFPVAIFGLSVFSTRLLSVICGSLLSITVYFTALELFEKKTIARISSLLTALSPSAIMFSRGAYESNIATFFLSLGVLGIVYSIKAANKKIVCLSILAFLVSIFTYSSPRIFLLLFFPLLFFFLKKNLSKRQNKLFRQLTVFIVIVIIVSLIDPRSRVRADDIGFLRDPWPSKFLQESIHEDGLYFQGKNIFVTRMFHNKLFAYGVSIFRRYLEHFDPNYLFMQSNPHMPKYSVPNVGLFYFFEVITILTGVYALAKLKDYRKWLLILWILLSIVPSSLSIETPSPIRALIGLPALIMLSALGVWFICSSFKKHRRFAYFLFGLILISHFLFFWHQYTIHDVYHQPWYSDGGVKEMILAVNQLENKFDKVVISGDPYIHFLFFNKVRPRDFLSDSEILSEKLGKWERVERFGKIIFKMPYNCPKIGKENVLYICKGEEIPQNSILHEAIYFPDGKPAFLLIEFVPYSEKKDEKLPERIHRMVDTDLSYHEALLSEEIGGYW
jgi:4-amino-4-deoxy-L-arabinose transferase-like glycosyltransferase